MTTPTINTDCTIRLTHTEVNSGEPYGFILDPENRHAGAPVSIQRQVDSDGNVTIRVYFNVLLADDLLNPDGSQHSQDRAAMYAALTAYLAQSQGLTLDTVIGSFASIGAGGHCATEYHYAGKSLVACQLNNAGVYYPPVDPARLYNSVWDGTLTWGSSTWR